ncbi:sigma-70 family RNA polymerase sigma factor [Asanoa sp. WMMD1127]|uniref:sigma-70 family RNA polymerase sigma factor n=1 Tax=Asanoa sp. WMMD1127 TaxID=3016107 RepID=UPI0024173A43|nr:sigma-70 family RNA polymerase sigma factor [Asanoa sp. WMMD1127]MDG4827463.1 sigma-70 family RNA polymerase sigma factor [Asanoa sp. WMMD1127]
MPEPDAEPDAEPVDPITERALAAGAGDRAAAAAFVEATQHTVRRFVAHLSDAGDVDDLTQETYLRAMRSLPSFDARSSATTWLLAIARRVCVDHVRSITRRPRVAPTQDWRIAAEAAASRDRPAGFEVGVALNTLVRALSDDRREAFVATQIAGLSYAEAAEVCGCPVGTIRSRVARAREDLVDAMTAGGRERLRPTS